MSLQGVGGAPHAGRTRPRRRWWMVLVILGALVATEAPGILWLGTAVGIAILWCRELERLEQHGNAGEPVRAGPEPKRQEAELELLIKVSSQ